MALKVYKLDMDKNQSFPYAPHHYAFLDDNQHTRFASPSSHLGQMFANVDKLQELAKLLLFTSSKESISGTPHCPVILSSSTKTVG
jgi:hypothetical protein